MQLFLLTVLPLTILVLAVTFGSLELHHQAMRSLVADRNLRAVQAAAASLEREMTHRGGVLELLASEIQSTQDANTLLQRAAGPLRIFDGGTAIQAANGNVLAHLGEQAVLTWLASAPPVETDQAGVGQNGAEFLDTVQVDQHAFIPVRVRTATGVSLVGLFSPEPVFSDVFKAMGNSGSLTVMVIDQNYQVLYHQGNLALDESLATHPGIREALEGASRIDYLPTRAGEHVITTSSIQSAHWALMMEESWEDIASPLLQLTQNAPLVVIPILVLSLLALWFGLRRIVLPLQALEGKASDLARGDFTSIEDPVGGVQEIQRLQASLIEMATQLKEAQDSLHSYIGSITASVENERRNLARELHDGMLQALIAIGQKTQFALHWNQDERVGKSLEGALSLNDQNIKDLRRLVQGLRPIYIEDLGLATALAMQANASEPAEGVFIHFRQEGAERRLKPDIELSLYRVAQEALNNVVRHAHARNAWITIVFQPKSLTLEVRDDGLGFDPPGEPRQYARQGHYGLLGMYERCELMGAKLSIRSSAENGTLVVVRLDETKVPMELEKEG